MKLPIPKKIHNRFKEKDFIIGLNKFDNSLYPIHWHEFYEIEICLSGEGIQKLNGNEYTLSPGTVTLLRLTDFHEYEFNSICCILDIGFSSNIFSNTYVNDIFKIREDIIVRLNENELETIKSLGNILLSEYKAESSFRHDAVSMIMNYILIMILRKTGKPESVAVPEHNSQIKRAVEYIDLHFRENPSLEEVAAIAGYSKNYFCQLFSTVTKQTFSQYLNHKKINYSKTLLSSTDIPVLNICMNSGFNTISNFIHVFNNEVGISPSQYRKQSNNIGT